MFAINVVFQSIISSDLFNKNPIIVAHKYQINVALIHDTIIYMKQSLRSTPQCNFLG